jgi:hypothetical protein
MNIKSYQMSFNGPVLERGFWIYVWKVATPRGDLFYVGRTGDSSSHYAGSPFSRIGQHLDFRKQAKGNSFGKRLREASINPLTCRFQMVAIGPLFPEQKQMEKHKPLRDKLAAIEHALGNLLRQRGLSVLGQQRSRKPLDEKLFCQIVETFDQEILKLN